LANELIELQSDAIVAIGSLAATALRQQTLPIVFVQVPDRYQLALLQTSRGLVEQLLGRRIGQDFITISRQ